jgi:Beta-propeller repeat
MRLFAVCLAIALSLSLAHGQTVTFSSYFGVADCDGIAIGPDGDLFLACHSPSTYLPVEPKPPRQSAEQGDTDPYCDAYVLRIDPRKGQVVYATRLGGSDYDESSRVRVDQHGFVWVLGNTKSHDFPTTSDAIQRNYGGGEGDGFLAKLAPDGRVVYATYLGGNGDDEAYALELDGAGGAFVGGWTDSNNFPGQSTAKSAHKIDAYIAHIDPDRPSRFHSVVFGGQEDEMLTGLALDQRGGLFGTGSTKSKDFPILHPTQAELRGTEDAFLVRFIANSLTPTFSTYFGGSGDTSAWGITVDRHGVPIIAGATDAGNLPTSVQSFQRAKSGGDTTSYFKTLRKTIMKQAI